jgi:rfaE bifunctional protein nucleotidyltransferase chain/domain
MLIELDLAQKITREYQKAGKKVVFTNGCFDILHAGHVTYLQQARDLGDMLILGLNSDSSVKELKGPARPVNNQNDRALVLSALKSVDFVVLFSDETPIKLIKEILPDFLVKGGDYTPETIVGADVVREKGGEVVVIPLVEGKSTTNIIEKMKQK